MLLDYVPSRSVFALRVPRDAGGVSPKTLVEEYGLDFSTTASTQQEAVLLTREKYAALSFLKYATPEAYFELADMADAVTASWRKVSHARIKTPQDKELWPFQRAGVEYAINRRHTLIGDQPGLGKTPQAICIANEISAKRVLVVCPANIRLQWAQMIREWSVMEGRYVVYPILKSSDGVHPEAAWTIISYDLLRSAPIYSNLVEQQYDLIIMDEAHYLKTPEASRTRAVFDLAGDAGLARRAERIVALTGTPLPNRPRECYTLARGLCFDAIDRISEDRFRERYNPSQLIVTRSGARYVDEAVGRLPELQNRLRANFMIRRLKRDVLTQLPDIRYEISYVEKTGDIRKALEAERMLDIDPTDFRNISPDVLGHISSVRLEMGLAKAPLVADHIAMCLEGGEDKLVVFGWHLGVLDILEQKLEKWGVVRVDGSTSPRKRQIAISRFQHHDGPRIFLGNIQSVGVGLDGLQAVASHAIFAECSWTPSDNEQAVGRLERIGQKSGILAEFLVAPGSFDEKILATALTKLQNIHSALDKEIA